MQAFKITNEYQDQITFERNGAEYTAHKSGHGITSLTIDVKPHGAANYRVHINPVDEMVQYVGFKMPWRISGQPIDKARGIADRKNLVAVYDMAQQKNMVA